MADPAAAHLRRNAYIYVRQSTLVQTVRNTESLLRQYDLAGRARQLTLDIPWPGRGDADRERVWNQMPDAARARVLCLLAAMIAAGVLAGDDEGRGAGAVRDDG